jgi:plasmid stabilization system protein ParE
VTPRLRLHPIAEAELVEAMRWYADRGTGLGDALEASFSEMIDMISRNPRAYPVMAGNLRRAVLKRFPYNVVYSITEGEIQVVAFYHGRRDISNLTTRAF